MNDGLTPPNCAKCGYAHWESFDCQSPEEIERCKRIASGSESGAPRDKQWLQDCAELVKNKMPENYCFVVFGFPTRSTDRVFYASNADRASVIDALKQWLKHAEENYLKHEK